MKLTNNGIDPVVNAMFKIARLHLGNIPIPALKARSPDLAKLSF